LLDHVSITVTDLKSHKDSGAVSKGTPQHVEVKSLAVTKDNVDSPQAADFVHETSCGA
jgi:hypothetical protein